jgi:hypothetical protein
MCKFNYFKQFNVILVKKTFPPIVLLKYNKIPLKYNEHTMTKSEYNSLVYHTGIQNIKHYIMIKDNKYTLK